MSPGAGQPESEDRGADDAGDGEVGAATNARVRALCAQTLARNWIVGERDGLPYAYTRPSPERYRWQWYWDSCFAAIAWRRFDPQRPRSELSTLLSAARED